MDKNQWYVANRILNHNCSHESIGDFGIHAFRTPGSDPVNLQFGIMSAGGELTPRGLAPWAAKLVASSSDGRFTHRFFGSATILDPANVLFTRHQLTDIESDSELGANKKVSLLVEHRDNLSRPVVIDIGRTTAVPGHDLVVGKIGDPEKLCELEGLLTIPGQFPDCEACIFGKVAFFCGWGTANEDLAHEVWPKNDVALPLREYDLPSEIAERWRWDWESRFRGNFPGEWRDSHLTTGSPCYAPLSNDSGGGLVMFENERLCLVGIANKSKKDETSGILYGLYVNLPAIRQVLESLLD